MEVIARSVHIDTREKAIEHRLLSSPTIRVNGVDIDADIKETLCESCGDLCGDSVDCRVWTYQGKEYTVPPVAMIMDAALRIIYGTVSAVEPEAYLMPENLQKYFDALERKNHDAG